MTAIEMTKGRDIPPLFVCHYPLWSIRSGHVLETGAGDGVRTRDPELGKLVLYQLSYTRMSARLEVATMKARSFARHAGPAETGR
jgi:hypothetical protein